MILIRSESALAAAPVLQCGCGHQYRGATCPCCAGTGVVDGDVQRMDSGKGGPTHAYYAGEKAPRTQQGHRPQIEAVLALMADGVGKTAACERAGITPKTFDYWRYR